ncbi:B-cell lymphoma 3 protein homolog [Pseudophryne corroboree]|uniref:B-cell lymphoma 3 protein homolog n=1 Tax=Pseudophryne corroboree TaxID=495146 RepID=UPI0030818E70
MDSHYSHTAGAMETSSPLDLSIRKSMNMLEVISMSPSEFWTRGCKPLKEVKLENAKQPAEGQNDSFEEQGLYKDQACLPLRKRKYPPSPKEDGPHLKYTDEYSEWTRKCYSHPYMAVSLPAYYQGSAAAYLPSTLPLYSAPAIMNPPLLRLLPPYHTALLPTDTDVQADIRAATQSDEDGDTALHIAVVHGNISAAQRVISLLKHGRKELDILNNLRQTPLHLAVITDHPDLVALLLEHGSSPQIPDRNGQTCVHLACEYGSMGSLEVLMRAGTRNLEATNYQGMTALHVAVSTGRRDITLCLLEHGAGVNAVDIKSGQSPIFQAVESGSDALVSLLLQHGAKVNAVSYAGNTALHVASGRGLVEITRLLLKSGADGSIKNCHNDTAMMVAKDRKIADIIRGKSSSPHGQIERIRRENIDPSCSSPLQITSSSCSP